MRGAFVACFGQVDQRELDRVAEAQRFHRGTADHAVVPGFHVAVRAEPGDGPNVDVRGGRMTVVHGQIAQALDDLEQRAGRFAAIECDGETLRAVRDPMGLAPLFYRVVGESLWLATEIWPLVALRPSAPDFDALAAQAALVPDDVRTGFEGIRRVLPGYRLHTTRSLAVTQERYWRPQSLFGAFRGTRGQAEDELWARLLEAVDRCLGGPTGILVSGGVDSAAVTAAAALLGRRLSLVHVTFPGVADAAEEPQARAVAAAADAELEVVSGDLSPWHPEQDLEVSVLPYPTPPPYTANAALARLAEQGLPVALDGNDGDGVLGYPGREWGELLLTGKVGTLLRLGSTHGSARVLRGIATDTVPPGVFRNLGLLPPRRPTYLEKTERYFNRSLAERIRSVDHERWRPPRGEWRWRQLRQVLPVTTVRMEEHELRGARFGIDLRHPFADRDLVEFLVSLPVAIKSDPLRPKALLRDALAGHAPDDVLERPEYLSILERRVDGVRCLEWIQDSGVRLPLVDYPALFRAGADPNGPPLFLLVLLARAHVFAAAV